MNSKGPAVLTSNVINEAQALFQNKALKKEGCEPLISQNDALFILRGLGMNPTAHDVEVMVADMPVFDPDEKKDEKKKKKGGGREEEKKKKDEGEEKKNLMMLPEDVPKYSWLTFIEATEGCYRSMRRCEEIILESFRVFDRQDQRGKITLAALGNIMSTLGDDVLATTELDELNRIFAPQGEAGEDFDASEVDIDFADFAKLIQEGQLPPPPPPPTPPPDDSSRKPSTV
eukprot:TRINITY_DN13335_c0_g1_i1.p1 TRINITY_DN13335_c0_g1~~TRINITY_DN13335_c0_g1_i1.p1  ORF type:complete len:230 (+),score=62.29 TRINITY_DN13335_c0_g1_i1:77-766(+)